VRAKSFRVIGFGVAMGLFAPLVASTASAQVPEPVVDEPVVEEPLPQGGQVDLGAVSDSPISPDFPLEQPPEPVEGEPVPVPPPAVGAESQGPGTDVAPDALVPPVAAAPVAETKTVTVGASEVDVAGGSVAVSAPDGSASRGAPVAAEQVRLRSLGAADAKRIGLPGGAVELSAVKGSGQVGLEFDLSYLVSISTADVLDRVQLVRYPACVLTNSRSAQCQRAQRVPFTIDEQTQTLRADVSAAPLASGAAVVGLSTATSSSTTNYAATPLQQSASWAVGEQSGSFSWSYPIATVPAFVGPSPSVSLNYSSQSVDGLSDIENNQGGQMGLGWSVGDGGGFIERSYKTCAADGTGWITQDLCWFTDNATLNLGGVSSRLIPTGTPGRWRLEQDNNWVVERTGTPGTTPYEVWRVYSPDGMMYEFGARWATSNSLWTAPVFGNNAGEPCYNTTAASAYCQQGWRWNLDRVTDANGNVMEYNYDRQMNRYGRSGFPAQSTLYTAGGWLTSIVYNAGKARVTFVPANRCYSNNLSASGCAWFDSTRTTPYWPDRPSELVCTSTTNCPAGAPTFFIDKVLDRTRSEVLEGSVWRMVHRYVLKYDWPDADTAAGPQPGQLWLREIERTGFAPSGANIVLPAVRFESINATFDNRADSVNFPYYRLDQINDEMGGRTGVTYFQPSGCPAVNASNPQFDLNTSSCFPQYTSVGGSGGFGYFNKFVVREVRETDMTIPSSQPVMTTYDYFGGVGWHRNDDPIISPAQRTYSDYRGYEKVRTTRGLLNDPNRIVNEKIYFRGMHGDVLPGGGTRSVSVSTTGGLVTDGLWRRGLLAESRVIDPVTGNYVDYSLSTYTPVNTATSGTFSAVRADLTAVYSGTRQGAGWRDTETRTTYTADGFAQTVWERGELVNSTDDTCTYTSFAPATLRLRGLPLGTQMFAGSTCTGAFQAFTQFAYDGDTTGAAAPTAGNVTRQRVYTSSSAYLETKFTYDAGRVKTVTDPRGFTTITAFNTIFGYPTSVTNALSQVTSTTIEPGHGVPLTTTDANNKVTTLGYDPLGRLTTVNRFGDTSPTTTFEYSITKTAPPWVRTTQTQSAGVTIPSMQYFDGLGRLRETSTKSPTLVGRIATITDYDNRGLTFATSDPYWVNSAYDAGLVATTGFFYPPRSTRFTYDYWGRQTNAALYAGGTLKWSTTTVFDGWLTMVKPPSGGAVRTEVDAFGRTIKTSTHDDTNGVTTPWNTTYAYTPRGEVASTTDHLGNKTTTTYDLAGRATQTTDPDRGTTTVVYDANGNVSTMTPANGLAETNYFDALNRPLSTWIGGFKRSEQRYDATNEKGLLDKSLTFEYAAPGTTQYPYEVDTIGYDARNRPTGTTYRIPVQAGITDGLNGTYTFTQTYNDADQPTSTTYPATADLNAAEQVNYTYWTTGQPRQTGGWEWYARDTFYDNVGYRSGRVLGPQNAQEVSQNWTYDQTTGRMSGTSAWRGGGAMINDTFTYDNNGNVTRVGHDPVGTTYDHDECYTIDGRNRMVHAYTTQLGQSCSYTTINNGGTAPYNDLYPVNEIGNLTAGRAGTYTYPASGTNSVRPHAPNTVGATSYTYDALGRRATSTTAGVTTTYGWGINNNNPTTVDRAGARIETNVYGPGGQRLIRKTGPSITLYLGGMAELTALPASGVVTAKRFYTSGGETVAVRSYSDVDVMVSSSQNTTSATASVYNADWQLQQYLPYGGKRGGDTLNPTERGFVGQTEDDAVGLVYLNNRHYDPSTGVFLSVDPLVSKTMQPYIYGAANPATLSDPTGLSADTCERNPNAHGCGGGGGDGGDGGDGSVPSAPPRTARTCPPRCGRVSSDPPRVCTLPRSLLCSHSRIRYPFGTSLSVDENGFVDGYYSVVLSGGTFAAGERIASQWTESDFVFGWLGDITWSRTDTYSDTVVSYMYHQRAGRSGDVNTMEMARWVGDVSVMYEGIAYRMTPEVPAGPAGRGEPGPSVSTDDIPGLPDLSVDFMFDDGLVKGVWLGDGQPQNTDFPFISNGDTFEIFEVQ
jgi:RHS repeat-associated protein